MVSARRRGGAQLSKQEQAALRRAIDKLVGPGAPHKSQRQLAQAIGWDVSSLTRAARGESRGSWDLLRAVAEKLETTPELLVAEPDPGTGDDLKPLARHAGFSKALAIAQRAADFDEETWRRVGQTRLPLPEEAKLTGFDLARLASIIAGCR